MRFEYLKKTLIGLALFLCAFVSPEFLYAQLSTGGKPYSFTHELNEKTLPAARMPEVDLAKLRAEDATEGQDGSTPCWRFAVPHPVRLNLQNAGHWQTLPGGDRLWRLQIDCPDAISVNLLYDDFYLPKGATLYLYRPDGQQVRGAFTARNNTEDRKFATAIVVGESVVLEYYEPLNVQGQGAISINGVNHGYRGYGENNIDLTTSGACQVNINCPEGDDWQTIKKSVAKYSVNGVAWCSGTLINNTAQDCRPLFLTANHCAEPIGLDAVTASTTANTLVFYWNFEHSACLDTGLVDDTQTTVGASILANPNVSGSHSNSSDFALYLLSENPREDYDVYFAGWDASGAAGTSGVGIHHPAGDAKKIATHNITPASVVSNRYWRIFWIATPNGQSVTEGGSSGSPLFRANGRVIGQLFGTFAGSNPNCSDPDNDNGDYGRLSYSWNNNGAANSRRRLRDHLDPVGLGATTVLDGTANPCCDMAITNITKTNEICPGANDGTITITATTSHGPLVYAISGLVNQSNATGIFTGLPDGNYNVTITDDGSVACDSNASVTIAKGFDITPPTLVCPADLTVSCDLINQLDATGEATATDNCDPAPVITYTDDVLSGDCEWECTVARTWKAVDADGNESVCVQTIISSSFELLQSALSKDVDGDGAADPLVVGRSQGFVILDAADAACIISWMPSKGDSAMTLVTAQVTVGADCLPGSNPMESDGTLTNPLFAEGIELGLKVRLDTAFANGLLSETSCAFEPIVLHFLPPNPRVKDLLRLANIALGNLVGPPHLSELLDAIRCVNAQHDICDTVNEAVKPDKKIQATVQRPQTQAPDFRVFPNPASSEVTIDLSAYPDRAVRLALYDVQGRLLQALELNTGETMIGRLNLTGYQDGIYLIRVQSAGMPVATRRIALLRN
mgnify:CR=1 FL=1